MTEELLCNTHYVNYVLNERNKLINKEIIESILKEYGLEHKVKNLINFQITH